MQTLPMQPSTPSLPAWLTRIDRLAVFAFMWAIATLFHQFVYLSAWVIHRNPLGILLTLSAGTVLLRPRSVGLFLVMLTLSIGYWFQKMPFLSNHLLFQIMIDLFILVSMGWALLREARRGTARRPATDAALREELFDAFAPVARAGLIILYFFAVFHKLNWGFLDPKYSMAARLIEETAGKVPIIPVNDALRYFAIWSTLILETAIAVMLCLRRTRNAGILLALLFHLFLTQNPSRLGFSSFTAMLFALFFLFAPRDFPARLSDLLRRLYAGWTGGQRGRMIGMAALVVLAFGAACLLMAAAAGPRRVILVWMAAWGGLLAVVFIAVMRLYPTPQEGFAALFRPRWSWQWLAPLLLLFNGMNPYLGLKTASAFNMFTNLRTEGGQTNHLFMPQGLKLAHYQDDLVEIIRTDHPALKPYEPQSERMITYFEFQRLASSEKRDFFVEYRRNGKPARLQVQNGVSNDPAALERQPAWVYKLVGFKPINHGPHIVE